MEVKVETAEEKKARLEKQKKAYESNRTLAILLAAFLLYTTLKDVNETPAQWYFYLVMGLLFVFTLVIVIRDTLKIKSIDPLLEQAEKELPDTSDGTEEN